MDRDYFFFSCRKIHSFSGTARGLFASPVKAAQVAPTNSPLQVSFFQVGSSDPGVNLTFALDGLGITVLPLWLAKHPNNRMGWFPFFRGGSQNRSHCVRSTRVHLD